MSLRAPVKVATPWRFRLQEPVWLTWNRAASLYIDVQRRDTGKRKYTCRKCVNLGPPDLQP